MANSGILHEIAEGAFGVAAWEATKIAFSAFLKKGGEQAAGYATEALIVNTFGLKEEDERRYNAALNLMEYNDRVRLTERIAQFRTPRLRNLYRLTVLNDNQNVTVATMTRDAQWADADWNNHVIVMGYSIDQVDRFLRQWKDFDAFLLAPGGAVETTRDAATEMKGRATSVWDKVRKG